MSSLPPNIAGSILQSNLTQRQVSSVREKDRTQQHHAERQNVDAIDEKDSTVETSDDDTRVDTDAEGGGSMGRAFTEDEQQQDQENPAEKHPPDPTGQRGHHIDLEA
jgi:hypothetical protein